MGLTWRPLRPSWSGLGGLLVRLGASGSRKGEKANIIFQWKINEFGFSGLSSPVYVCCVSVLYMLCFCTHVRLCACMHIRMHECMHVCMRMHVCVLVCMCESTGLRPLPPPCLGGGSEASCVFVGSSWSASRGPLGGMFEASWGPFWGFLGPFLGLLGASWGLLGGSWGPLGAS